MLWRVTGSSSLPYRTFDFFFFFHRSEFTRRHDLVQLGKWKHKHAVVSCTCAFFQRWYSLYNCDSLSLCIKFIKYDNSSTLPLVNFGQFKKRRYINYDFRVYCCSVLSIGCGELVSIINFWFCFSYLLSIHFIVGFV